MNFFTALTQLQAYFLEQAKLRRAQPRDDLLTRLVHAEIDGEHLTDVELQAFLILLLVAGNETTTNNIGCAVRLLADDPALLARVRDDRSLVRNLIEESLRVESPIQGFYRKALVDVEVSGRADQGRRPPPRALRRGQSRPRVRRLPGDLQPRRRAPRPPSLRQGRALLSRREPRAHRVELAINGVLDHFDTMTPLVKDDGDVDWRPTPFFRGMVEYPIAYTAYPRPLNAPFESAYRFN